MTTTAKQAGDALKTLIEDSIRYAPRSLQTMIGPSEIGMECDHCLAARLAGWIKTEPTVGWLPFIGTCVHAYYEDLFTKLNNETPGAETQPVFLCENRVTVGEIDGKPVTGSTDLFLPDQYGLAETGMTVDWKIVGKSTLDRVKRNQHPGRKYEVQAHLYARGWNQAGYPTSHVCVYFQPRNSLTLNDGYIWIAEYDEQIALDGLARVERMLKNIRALETVSKDARDKWITGLPREPGCFDCAKYPDFHTTLGQVF
ncbi:hypothetical protein [Arcanobacterium buesumense]|uniref:Uncharacterized protein n=1 Tax=Arcanobacterium buesumense TaxID=2722751 RepID=A0A6H2ELS4_9ACTO|nr:hypothetical protein [Arcanobacterium buesumense]QJC22024.1 hypothetical protein HC352_05585 [Arcanobacterium buesumense]